MAEVTDLLAALAKSLGAFLLARIDPLVALRQFRTMKGWIAFNDAVTATTINSTKTTPQKVCWCAGENLIGWAKGNRDGGGF